MIDIVCPKCFSDFVMWRVSGEPSAYCMACGHEWDGLPRLRQLIKEKADKHDKEIEESDKAMLYRIAKEGCEGLHPS